MGWYTDYKIWVRTASGFSRSVYDIEKQIKSVTNAAKFLNCEEKYVEEVCEICWLRPQKISGGLFFTGNRKRGDLEFLKLFMAYIKFTLGAENVMIMSGMYRGEDWYADMNLGFPRDTSLKYINPAYEKVLQQKRVARRAKRKRQAKLRKAAEKERFQQKARTAFKARK